MERTADEIRRLKACIQEERQAHLYLSRASDIIGRIRLLFKKSAAERESVDGAVGLGRVAESE